MSLFEADFAVVGAGFTGLVAAHRLRDAGRSVLLLEALPRVGGRVESAVLSTGRIVDTGGQFLCEDMPQVMALARRFGKTFVETRFDGQRVVQPPRPAAEADRVSEEASALRRRMKALDLADPALARLTVGDWLDRQPVDADVKASFRAVVEGLWCAPIGAIPLWFLVGNDRRITNRVGELQYFLAETMHSLARDLAAALGDRLWLGAAVEEIGHRPGGVALSLADGRRVEAGAALVAVPPSEARRIRFAPALPPPLAAALDAWQSGSVIKILVGYPRAFWRESGLSGAVAWREPTGLFACDASADDRRPTLVVFVGGPLALQWHRLGKSRLRDTVLARLAAALGPAAAEPSAFLATAWVPGDGAMGGYSDLVMDIDARDAEDVLRAGLPPLHFASSELSPSFPGYIEGAIVAGRAAAEGVLASQAPTPR